jgi:hypothetical protein
MDPDDEPDVPRPASYAAMMRTCVLERRDWERWNAYVAEHPAGTAFHSTRWLEALSRSVEVFVVEDAGELHGGIALAHTRKYGLTSCHIPPYTPYGGPLVGNTRRGFSTHNSEQRRAIEALLAAISHKAHVDFVLPPGEHDPLPYRWAGCELELGITYEVRGDDRPLIERIASRSRSYVRRLLRALEAGELVATWDEDWEVILDLWEGTGARNQFDPRRRLLEGAVHKLGPTYLRSVLIRDREGAPLAGSLCARDHRRTYNLIPTTNRSARGAHGRAGLLSYYLLAEDTLARGQVFDFEGSAIRGIADFYRTMGGIQVPVYRVQRTRSAYYAALRGAKRWREALAHSGAPSA